MNISVEPSIDDKAASSFLAATRFAIFSILAFGLLYPVLATYAGKILFPQQANGSLIVRDGVTLGSSLVAQNFVSDRYFQSRPSAANYDPRAMAGSNLASSNPVLRERIVESSKAIAAREYIVATHIPVDMVTTSGSGIDPHISPEAAQVQLARVAKARGLSVAQVQALIKANTQTPSFGILGQSRVNVLQLNLALDAIVP
ncbi:MAG: potassium-transporting ATPase subunit KdpC [Methylococcales bacterium]